MLNFLLQTVVFFIPFYLIRFKIFGLPTNVFEVLFAFLFISWTVLSRYQKSGLNTVEANGGWGGVRARGCGRGMLARQYLDRFQGPLRDISISLVLLGAALSTLFSQNTLLSAGILKSWFVVPIILCLITAQIVKNEKQIRGVVSALFLSGVGVSLISLFYWAGNHLTYDGRLRAFYLSPNYLALYLSPILLFSLYLHFNSNLTERIILVFGQCLILLTVYLTYSYGAYLSLMVPLIFVLAITLRNKKMSRVVYLFVFVMLLLCLLQIPSQKFGALFDSPRSSFQSRLMIWRSAWEIAKDHPVLGIGPGMFQEHYLRYQPRFAPYLEWAVPQPHSLFLAFWLQTGLIGLTGFILLLVRFFVSETKKLRVTAVVKVNEADRLLSKQMEGGGEPDPANAGEGCLRNSNLSASHNSNLPVILLSVMLCILIHGLFDTPYWKNDLSVIFWLVIGVSYTANRLSC